MGLYSESRRAAARGHVADDLRQRADPADATNDLQGGTRLHSLVRAPARLRAVNRGSLPDLSSVGGRRYVDHGPPLKKHSRVAAPTIDAASLARSLRIFESSIKVSSAKSPASHEVLVVDGLDTADGIWATAVYLIACLAGAVRVDTSLAARILGGRDDPVTDLRRRVRTRLGSNNDWSTTDRRDWRDRRRNPWITEGIAHALMLSAPHHASGMVIGTTRALKPLHPQVTQQGLDIVGIYADPLDDLWLAIGEGKATAEDPSGQLTDAADFFRKIERGDRNGDLIADLLLLEPVLAGEVLDELGETLWLDRRTYAPLIAFGTAFDGKAERPVLQKLKPPRNHKRVVLVRLSRFLGFMDDVADAARTELPNIVR
jgi:hypothetical protein